MTDLPLTTQTSEINEESASYIDDQRSAKSALSLRKSAEKRGNRRESLRSKGTLTGKGIYIDDGEETDNSNQSVPSKKTKRHANRNNRNPWQSSEDELLKQLVGQYGKKWSILSKKMGSTRTGKQIRDRWVNKLDTSINEKAWTAEEDQMIITFWHQYGNRWSEIARHIDGRTESMVKNRYYSHLVKRRIGRNGELLDECANDSGATNTHQNQLQSFLGNGVSGTCLASGVTTKLEDNLDQIKKEMDWEYSFDCKVEIAPKVESNAMKQEETNISRTESPLENNNMNYHTLSQAIYAEAAEIKNLMNFRREYLEALAKSPMGNPSYNFLTKQLVNDLFGNHYGLNPALNLNSLSQNMLQEWNPVHSMDLSKKEAFEFNIERQKLMVDSRAASNDSQSSITTIGSLTNYLSNHANRRSL